MTAKLIPASYWNAASFSPQFSPQILRRWCRDGRLRSLSLRLYHDHGINAQALAGHNSADMTSVYRDVRGDEWVKVK